MNTDRKVRAIRYLCELLSDAADIIDKEAHGEPDRDGIVAPDPHNYFTFETRAYRAVIDMYRTAFAEDIRQINLEDEQKILLLLKKKGEESNGI